MHMEFSLKQKLFYFFPVLFCFCLPFGSLLLSGLIVLWTLISFFNIETGQLRRGFSNKNLWILYIFFVLTAVSALFSSNKAEALFSIEIKLSFLLFPYLLFCFKWPTDILRRCVISFVSGCFFACLYLIARAFLYAFNGQPDYFFYSLFSDFIHASYFAMYLIMAIVFIVVFYDKWFKTQKNIIYSSYFFFSIFITSIFLCSSKLGLISFFICIPMLLLYRFKEALSARVLFFILTGVIVLFVLVVSLFPGVFARFNSLNALSSDDLDKTSSESTTVRILIWKESAGLIKSNFLFGTGVGDANDELQKAYAEQGLTGALEHRFNAHNQFLQTFIGLGIIGFLLLLMVTLGEVIIAVIKRNFLLLIFSLIIILNFAVESMLQTSAGVLFFTFFFCFFNLVGEKQLVEQ
jgi:O-antigen ligase